MPSSMWSSKNSRACGRDSDGRVCVVVPRQQARYFLIVFPIQIPHGIDP